MDLYPIIISGRSDQMTLGGYSRLGEQCFTESLIQVGNSL
jgi:hypothetical protein